MIEHHPKGFIQAVKYRKNNFKFNTIIAPQVTSPYDKETFLNQLISFEESLIVFFCIITDGHNFEWIRY